MLRDAYIPNLRDLLAIPNLPTRQLCSVYGVWVQVKYTSSQGKPVRAVGLGLSTFGLTYKPQSVGYCTLL